MRTAKILFAVASILLILGGVAHFVGQFSGKEPERIAVIEAMKNYRIAGGGFSLWDVMQAFGVGMGAYIIGLGVLNLVLAGYLAERPAMLRNAALVNAAVALTIVLATVHYRIFPPAMVTSPQLILFPLAAISAQRAMQQRAAPPRV